MADSADRPDAKNPVPISAGRHIALAHDWLVGMRGGERVLDRFARQFGPTALYTLVDDDSSMSEAIRACDIVTSPLQRLPAAAGSLRRWYLPLYRWAVESISVQPCEVLLSSSSAVMKSIRPPAGATHICYCHSPARYIWEQTSDYARGSGGRLRGFGLRAMRRRFQQWDRATCDRVDVFIANSRHTASRINRCYGRDAQVIYPPVRTTYFTPDESVPREDWYLIVAALEPYKRTDLAIEAARRGGWQLKVIGDGSQRAALEREAHDGIEFLGRVDDQTLRDHYRRARALVFPQVEDFGIIAVEAQACGCPVIAAESGGGAEIVTAETGVLASLANAGDLVSAVETLNVKMIEGAVTSPDCVSNATRFREERFDAEIADAIAEAVA